MNRVVGGRVDETDKKGVPGRYGSSHGRAGKPAMIERPIMFVEKDTTDHIPLESLFMERECQMYSENLIDRRTFLKLSGGVLAAGLAPASDAQATAKTRRRILPSGIRLPNILTRIPAGHSQLGRTGESMRLLAPKACPAAW